MTNIQNTLSLSLYYPWHLSLSFQNSFLTGMISCPKDSSNTSLRTSRNHLNKSLYLPGSLCLIKYVGTLNNSFWLGIKVSLPRVYMGNSTASRFHSRSLFSVMIYNHLVSFDLLLQSQISYWFISERWGRTCPCSELIQLWERSTWTAP